MVLAPVSPQYLPFRTVSVLVEVEDLPFWVREVREVQNAKGKLLIVLQEVVEEEVRECRDHSKEELVEAEEELFVAVVVGC